MRVALGSDHGGFELKRLLVTSGVSRVAWVIFRISRFRDCSSTRSFSTPLCNGENEGSVIPLRLQPAWLKVSSGGEMV